MSPQAYRLYTAEGSRYLARFDPEIEKDGIIYGRMEVVGYSEVAQKHLRIIGIAPEPEPGGRLIVEDKPWAIEMIDGEEVPLYEYENITRVDDLSDVLEKVLDENTAEEKQKVEP